MINIFATNSYHSGARYIHRCLAQVDQSRLDTRHIVIVPDRCSLEAERQMLATVGGSFNIAVLTFRRLSAKILPQYQYLSKQAGVVAMSAIIDDCSSSLRCYTKGTSNSGFAESMYDTISQLKYCHVPARALLGDNLPHSVADKLHDIGTIYSGYNNFMQDRYIDSADKLDLLCDSISTSEFCKNSHFYLYDFDNFTAQELAILSRLIQHGRSVSVACCVSNKSQDKYLYINDIYHGVLALCSDMGITANIITDSHHTNAITEHIGNNLYRYTKPTAIDSGDFVSVFEGNTVVNEVYQLGCTIAKHVRNGGRYRDVFVITSDIDNYTNAIHTVFGQLGIPYFCDQQFCLANHVYSQLIIDYLSMCSHNMQIGYVHSVVKNPLLPYGDKAYSFVNYTYAYNVNYRLDKFTLGRSDANYTEANEVRQHLYSVYQDIAMPSSSTAVDYVHKVRLLTDKLQLVGQVEQFAATQAEGQLHQLAKVSMQVAGKVEEVLDSIADVLGNRTITLQQMIQYLTNGLSAVNISVLPTHSDCVIFANMAKSRKHDIKVLAILGANHGMLPMSHKDTRLLTDYNISVMNSCGILVTPDVSTENKRERFALYQLLCEPTSKLHISYSCSIAGESVLPSTFVGAIRDLFTVGGQRLPLSQPDHGIYSRRQALSRVVSTRQALLDGQIVNDSNYHQLCQLVPEADQYGNRQDMQSLTISGGKQLMLSNSHSSITKITSLYACPYKFYHNYGLGIRPIDKAELDASIIGDILHSVLEIYLAQGGSASDILDRVLAGDRYKAIFSDPTVSHKLRRLRAEADKMCTIVSAQLQDSRFVCHATELQFGMGDEGIAPVSIPYDGGTLHLSGKIDRVDRWGDMFVVVDYKSGSIVEYDDCSLYNGHKLQLLVYLQAVIANMGWKPAGFYYFQLHNDFDKKNKYDYIGRTLADTAVVKALDSSFVDKSDRYHVYLTQKGTFNKRNSKVLTANQMNRHIQYSYDMIRQAGQLMSSGYIAMTPYEGECKFCDYKGICDYGDIYTHAERKVSAKAVKQILGGDN